MTTLRRIDEEGNGLGDSRGPVTGGGRGRRDRVRTRPGQPAHGSGYLWRREAALRVLVEAYRRDVGPGTSDPR